MLVERFKNEILIRIPSEFDENKLQHVLDLIYRGELEVRHRSERETIGSISGHRVRELLGKLFGPRFS